MIEKMTDGELIVQMIQARMNVEAQMGELSKFRESLRQLSDLADELYRRDESIDQVPEWSLDMNSTANLLYYVLGEVLVLRSQASRASKKAQKHRRDIRSTWGRDVSDED